MKLINRWKLDEEPIIINNKSDDKKEKTYKVGDKKVTRKDGKLVKNDK